ncbi:MAG: hypothetical protein LIP01_15315 [Tannerellaceae bacterium]|nr:hypothetical protein [Tannerellaceae bacterium]
MTEELTQEQLRLRVMELEKENETLKASIKRLEESKDIFYEKSERLEKVLKAAKGIADGLVTLLDQSTS